MKKSPYLKCINLSTFPRDHLENIYFHVYLRFILKTIH